MLTQKYQIILADPPWKYNDPKGNDPAMGGITYPVMSDDELAKLPISDLADKDCALFLWATMPKLKEAITLGEQWGFRYITCAFTWVKLNPLGSGIYSGLGHWTNGNAELCLFFKKGKPKRQAKNIKQIQIHPRGKHSEKPKIIREEIVKLLGDLPRIELFARQTATGWDALGHDIDGLDIKQSLELLKGGEIKHGKPISTDSWHY